MLAVLSSIDGLTFTQDGLALELNRGAIPHHFLKHEHLEKSQKQLPPCWRLIKYWGFHAQCGFSTRQLIRRSRPQMMGLCPWNKLSLQYRSAIQHHFLRVAKYLVLYPGNPPTRCPGLWKLYQHNMPQFGFELEITLLKSIIRWLVTCLGSQGHTLTTILPTTTSFQLVVQKKHCIC